MSKILNEILIKWAENQEEVNDSDFIIQTKDVNKAIGGYKSRLTELGSNLIGSADMLLVYGVGRGNESFKNYAWFNDNRMWCYTPMKSGLNFLSPEALKCIDWIEIKGGDGARKCIHINYLGHCPDNPNLFSFSGISASGDKIKWFMHSHFLINSPSLGMVYPCDVGVSLSCTPHRFFIVLGHVDTLRSCRTLNKNAS